MVPPNSYPGSTYNHNTKIYEKFPISKELFFKAINLLIKNKSKSWFEENLEPDDSTWYRNNEMKPFLKLIGLGATAAIQGLASKMFWAAYDNYDGIISGTITNYDQLELRALSLYTIPLIENVHTSKSVEWSPEVKAYSEDDAFAEVMYDDDGYYEYYEWDGHKSYEEDHYESDSDGKEENDIIDDLKEALEIWQTKEYESDKERWGEYHKDIEAIVNKYKNLSLNEIYYLKEATSQEKIEDFAEGRGKGAEKITENAKEKGGNSMLTYHHFKVKLPYYEKAAEGNFKKEKEVKEYKKLLENLYQATKGKMNIKQIEFQELMGKIEVLGELILENK